MPNRLSLARMSEFVRAGRLAPSDLVEAHLCAIESLNGKLNALAEVYWDEAREAARRAEKEMTQRRTLGPLHGVPVTVKDSFDISGRVTACGSKLRSSERASNDSVAVARLRGAGAIVIGKTSCPEFLMNYETDNHLTGRVNNPWDLSRTAGGSSGGEAAAIASFCSPGGMGSDGGGSIREPAHFCGIAGLKPTPGRVPAVGHWPNIAYPTGFMGVGGPMARSAADVELLFKIVSGHDARDTFSAPVEYREAKPGRVRIGVYEQWAEVPVQQEPRDAVRRAARLFAEAGHAVVEFDTSPWAAAPRLWWFLFGEMAAPALRGYINGRESECHWTGLELISEFDGQPPPSVERVFGVLAEREALRTRMLEALTGPMVLLGPGCGVGAFAHGARTFETADGPIGLREAMAPLTPWNLFGFPSLAVPVSAGEGSMPSGIQLTGAPYSEEVLLALACQLEEARGPLPSPPLE